MTRKKKKYCGVIIPMITPFTEDYKIDEHAAARIINTFIENNSQPLIFGTTGESASIPEGMKLQLLNFLQKEFNGRTKIFAVISDNCLMNSVEAAKKYFDIGVEAVVALLPGYYQLTSAQMLRYYEFLAEKISGPLFLYNIPATTHLSIPLEVVDNLSHHEKIVGLKDSERDLDRLEKSIKLWKDREDFSHFIGWGAQCFSGMWKGSDGIVPSTGNFAPGVYRDMYQYVLDLDKGKGETSQNISMEISAIYQKDRILGESLAALKVMLNEIGLCGTTMMPPLTGLSDSEVFEIRTNTREIIRKYNLI